MFRLLAALLVLAVATARADEPADPAPTEPAAPAVNTKEIEAAVKAARDAADSAKAAAEAAKAMAETMKELNAKSLAAMQPAPEPKKEEPKAEEKKPEEKKETPWAYQLGVNLINITGNANNVAGKAALKVDGKWEKWALGIKTGAAYGQASLADNSGTQVTAQNADLTLRGDRKFDDTYSMFLLTGALTDRVASIDSQLYGELGFGIRWWETKAEGEDWVKSRLATDFGFRYTREDRFRFFASADSPVGPLDMNDIIAIRALGSFKYGLSKTSVFSTDLEVLPDIRDTENLRANLTAALSAQVDKGFAIQLSLKARYIGKPAAGAQTLDTETGAGFTLAF